MNNGIKKVNWKSILVIWISILGLITGVQIVQQKQDDRSSAVSEVEEVEYFSEGNAVICGLSDGLLVLERPIVDLCDGSGSPIWTDSVAEDGDYNWTCVDESGDLSTDCVAFLE